MIRIDDNQWVEAVHLDKGEKALGVGKGGHRLMAEDGVLELNDGDANWERKLKARVGKEIDGKEITRISVINGFFEVSEQDREILGKVGAEIVVVYHAA